MEKITLGRTDELVMERTRLANERTFVVFVSSGFAILKLSALREIEQVGYFLIVIGPLILIIGVIRFYYVRRKLKKILSQGALKTIK